MTARIIHHNGTVEECSDSDFYSRIFGTPRTKAEREAQYRSDIEKYISAIEDGLEALVPPAYLDECRRIIALREEVHADPFGKRFAA